jgi:hypothetical protein
VKTTTDQIQLNFPFLTCVRCNEIEVVGIVLNHNDSVISIYDLSLIKDDSVKTHFLEMGDTWWWESNRKIPINIFLKTEMTNYRNIIKTFNSKDIEILFGPVVKLNDIAEKRVKRKSIQLVRSKRIRG